MGGAKALPAHRTAVSLVLVEELFIGSNDAGAGSSMEESVWVEVPDELVDRILLFLPAISQARFRCVCKRWREVMASAAFREQTAMLAFDRGYPVGILQLPGSPNMLLRRLKERFKVREVEIPGLGLPPRWSMGNARVFSHSRLPLVGVALPQWESQGLQCWLLNLADQTWQELPTLLPLGGWLSLLGKGWSIWMAPAEGMDFQVFFYHCASGSLSTYSGTSTDWCSVSALEVAHDLHPQIAAWMSLSPLPDAPNAQFQLLSDSDHGSAVFGYSASSSPVPAVSLYTLDEGSGSRWECVFSGLPPRWPAESVLCCSVHKAQIVGNLLLVVAGFSRVHGCVNSCHILAYHTLKRSWKWLDQALHPAAYRCFTAQEVSLVTPRISDLRL